MADVTPTTNVPPIEFTAVGPVAPQSTAILAGALADVINAMGGGLNPALDTPQGQLASSNAALISQAYQALVFLANQFDPAYAFGRYQDALARILGLQRNPAQPTVVDVLCSGASGLVIPAGSLVVASDGNQYASAAAGTIGLGGTVTISFACAVPGPIACPADSISEIYQAIPGWDRVDNPTDGVIGNDVESRAAFATRIAASVAINSNGALPAILGAVLAVPNVLEAYVTENATDMPVTVGDFTLAPHSLYVAAVGGDDLAVATAIWSKKAPGCGYNGNTTVTVEDASPEYSIPLPSYDVTFERPSSLVILFDVELANNAQVPANADTLVQAAIIAAFAGADGGQRASIGSILYASRFYGGIAAIGPWVQIKSIRIGSINDPDATITGSITGATLTVATVVAGALAIGQTLQDVAGNIAEGTTIISGGGTSWTLSISQTDPIALETMYGVVADRDDITVGIDQAPATSAPDIAVNIT